MEDNDDNADQKENAQYKKDDQANAGGIHINGVVAGRGHDSVFDNRERFLLISCLSCCRGTLHLHCNINGRERQGQSAGLERSVKETDRTVRNRSNESRRSYR